MTLLSPHAKILARLYRLSQAAKVRGGKGAHERYQQLIERFVAAFPKAEAELRDAYAPDAARRPRAPTG